MKSKPPAETAVERLDKTNPRALLVDSGYLIETKKLTRIVIEAVREDLPQRLLDWQEEHRKVCSAFGCPIHGLTESDFRSIGRAALGPNQ